MTDQVFRDRTLEVHERLLAYYGEPAIKEQRDPLSELVLTILTQNTSDLNSGRAYDALRAVYATWDEVLDAGPDRVADLIRPGGLANIKAPRICKILADIKQERGELTLDHLSELDVEVARKYLLSLKGVGPKTAACVLLFSMHMPAMPVDTHVHRVSIRLGLAPDKISAEKAHDLLEALVPTDLYYSFHLLMIQHGREICHARKPGCDGCPLAGICPDLAAREAVE